jgi:hypothetical protein
MPNENCLKLTFTVNERDVRDFVRYHLLHAPRARLWTWGVYAVLILWPSHSFLTTDFELSPTHALYRTMPLIAAGIAASICALIGPPFFLLITRLSARQWSRQNNGIVGDRVVEVSAEGISWSWETGQSTQTWASFQRVVGTREQILLYQGQNMAQLIPGRAFASPAAADTFFQLVRDWHAAATTGDSGSHRGA